MKKRVLSMLMALALCLTLLPTAALAEELEALNGAPAASVADAGAQNGGDAAVQDGEDGVSVQSGEDGIAVQAASAEQTESSVASVVIDGTTSYYDTLREAIMAAGEKAGSDGTPPTITLLQDGVKLSYPTYNSAESRDDPTYPATIAMGGNSLSSVYFLYDTLTLTGGTVNGTWGADLRSGGSLIMTAPENAEAAVSGPLKIINISGQVGTAKVSGAKVGVKGTLRVESSAANAVVISGSEKAVELDSEAYLSSGGRFYGSTEENGSPDTVAVFDAGQKTYTVNGVTAKKLVSGPKAVVAVTPGDTLSVMAGEAQEYTAQFTADGVVSGSVKGLGDLQATVENGDANNITVNVAENAADGTWKVTVQTAESTPLETYTLNLSSAVDGAVSGSVQFKVSETKYAASVNGTNYRSLSAAVDAAKNVNGTVTLLDNVTDSITVTDGTFTIDLNGKTWTGASDSRALTVNGGKVTLSSTGGAGTIVGSDTNKYAVRVDSGTVHLKENVTLSNRIYIADQNGGSVTFEPGVTVTQNIMTSSHSVVRFLDGLALQNASKAYVPFHNVHTNKDPLGYVTVVDHPTHHMVDGVCDQCGYVCGHSNAKAEDTVCPDCGAKFIATATAADGTVTRYTNADAALAAAAGNAKVTFVPGTYTLKNMTMLYGSAEIDLQGATLQYASDYNGAVLWMEDNSVSATIKNGIIQNIGEGTGIYLYRGSTLTLEDVTVIGDTYKKYSGYSINVANYGNTLTVKSGSFSGPLNLKLANNTVKLYGGTYQNGIKTYDKTAKDYAALLDNSDPAKQYAYADGAGSVITYDEVATRMNDSDSTNNSIQVKEHTHTMGGTNTCTQCGFVCTAHQYKNGVCAICKAECPHANVDTSTRVCSDCGLTMVAAVTVKDNDVTTYAADLSDALAAAKDGDTIKLLANATVGTVLLKGKTVTLDLNGKTVKNSGRGANPIQIGPSNSSAKLIITGRGSFISVDQPLVVANGTLDLSQWTGDDSYIRHVTISGANSQFISPTGAGKINTLAFIDSDTEQAADTASLNGGRYGKIVYKRGNTIKLGDLLAEGYAFRQNGTFLEYARELKNNDTVEEVEVVKCPHPDAKDGKCLYCGQTGILARVGDTTYDDVSKAVTDWLANGGTLKLYADYTAATEKATWTIVSGEHSIDLNGHMMSVQGDGAFKPTNNMHLTVTDDTERGQITNILLDGSQRGSFTLESGIVGNLEMTGGAVVALKGGSVDNLDVQDCSENTNLSIQGGSLGKLNIEDWAEGMHVSATGGSLGAYNLPSGKILADVLDHQYYAEGTSLDRQVDATAQKWEQFVIKQAPHDFGSTSQAANVPINGSIPFRVDSPSENVGVYEVKWYRRTDSGAEHMVENKVARVNVDDTLDVFCVITGLDRPNGEMQWQVAVKDYTIKVVPANLNGDRTVITQKPGTGNTGNPTDNRLVVTPFSSSTLSDVEYKFEVTYNRQPLELNKDYTIKDSSNLAKNAGTHTLTIVGIGNYTGEKSVTWTLEPYELSVENLCYIQINKAYDGTDAVTDSTNGIDGLGGFMLDSKNLRNPRSLAVNVFNLDKSDYELSNMKFDSAEAGDRTFTGTMTLKPGGNFVFAGGSRVMQIEYGSNGSGRQFVSINRAIIAAPAAKALQVANNHTATYTVDLSALLPKLESPKKYGEVAYALDTVSINGGYYDATKGNAEVKDGKLILPIQAVETKETGSIGSVTITVSTTNYHDFPLTINVNTTNKIVPTGDPTLSTETLTYGQALSAIKLSGKLHDNVNNKDVEGTFTWANGTVKPSAGSYEAAWKFTPTDGATYAETTGTVSITVNKAKPAGDPTYTRITAANKTLKDAALKPNTSWPTGTIQWVDKDGKVLPDTTEVKANTEYTWSFTPADTANYNGATGELTLYSVSTGGGGGGGSSSGSTVKTDTVTNLDGSVTKTETKKDGTVIETTTGKDGSTTKTETKKDGSSVTENKAADGSTGTVKTDKHGQTTAETTLSSKAVEDAKKNGEAVKAPVEVEASRDSNTAPTVKIELPRNSGDTKVEIPVTNVKPGTVAVLVHPDGTEEIVKNSLPTEDGIQLTVNGGATVKIMDNSKDFIDTRAHWAKDAIDFVSARGLLNGTSANTFSPNAPTTRAQLWTVLARQADADLTGGANWYEKAQAWAKEKGISDGANPNGTINRAQMVTMLWRTMGQPTAGGTANFTDVPADSYYASAVAWAVENGITAGVGGGRFDPNSTCTRAQIATFLRRAVAE